MGIGATYERRARKILEDRGFTVRRCAASAFPDLLAWTRTDFWYVEVKKRDRADGLSHAKQEFREAARETIFLEDAVVQLWVYQHGRFLVWDWIDGELIRQGGNASGEA